VDAIPPSLSVVVPTFRAGPELGQCLEALARQTIRATEIIVVDDGSGDGAAARIAAGQAGVRVLELPENRGFCGAVNAGLEAAGGEIVALLNDDTVPDREWARELLRGFADPAVGFCASRMMQLARPELVDGAGDGYSRHGLSFRAGRGAPDPGRPGREVLWASGGACAFRAAALAVTGPLDTRLEAYYEDVDLGIRATRAGFRGRYLPASSVLHVGSASDAGGRSVYLTTRNAIWVVAKHWPARLIARNLPFLLYGQARTAAWVVRHGGMKTWLRGVRDGLGGWRSMRRSETRAGAAWWALMDARYPFGPLPRPRLRRPARAGAPGRSAR
jgi:GT2 family glycosyltransferase